MCVFERGREREKEREREGEEGEGEREDAIPSRGGPTPHPEAGPSELCAARGERG